MHDATRARLEQHQQDPRLFWFTREDGTRDEFHYCTACGAGGERWPCYVAALLAAYDALRAERDQDAPVLAVWDDVMTTLDWVSTSTEGTPKQPFLEIHRRVGEQMRQLNAWRAAREG